MASSVFAQQDPSKGLTQYKLDNGLTVFLWEDHNQPDVHGRIVTRAGALDEPADYTGLAHYLEHVLFKGTKNIGALDWSKEKPLYEEIIKLYDQLATTTDEKVRAEIIKTINEKSMEAAKFGATDDFSNLTEGMGGEGLNAFTSYDLTAYFNNFPSFQMEKWLELNSERLMDPVFRSFQAELENVFEEYNMYQDDNETHVTEFLFDNLYKGHPYSRDVIGKPEHLKNPSLSALIKFFQTWYVPNNMALVLVGNFDSETVKPMIAEKFGRLKAKELPARPTYNPTAFEGNPKVSAKLGYYPQVVWGYNGVKKGDKDELLLDFTLSLLNNEHSTGLLDKLMLDGDIQMAFAQNDARRDLGRILVMAVPYFDIAQNMYESNSATEKIILKEVDKLKNGTFEDWLFQSVKAQLLQSYKVMFERPSSKVDVLTYAFAYNEPVDVYLKMNERVNAITREDVQRTAQKYLGGNHITVTIEEGTPKKNKLKKPEIKPLDPPKGVETAYSQKIKAMPIGTVQEKYNDFNDVKKVKLYNDVTLFCSDNKVNDVFTLTLKYGVGTEKMPKLEYATALMNTAGVMPDVDAQSLRRQFSELGASCSYGVDNSYFYIQLTGDEKNLAEICKLMTRQTLFPKLDNKQLERVIGGELNNRMIEKKEDLAYCMYYFVVFDHGLSRMAKSLNRLLNCEEVDNGDMLLVKSCVTLLVNRSIEMGAETKADWEDTIEDCTPEIWKEVMFALRKVKGRRGNRKVIQSLDDILWGGKERIKQGIRLFLEENTEDISLAYLLQSLVKSGKIKASTRYMTFHRAIEQFSQRHYGHDIPQKRYGEIKELTLNSPQRGSSYTKAKRIIDRWTDYFANNG